MPKGYHHLTYDQRCQLSALKKSGASKSRIANELGVDRSTIYRELARNTGQKGYWYRQANRKAVERRCTANRNRGMVDDKLSEIIHEKLKLQWSPEQISGWLKRQMARINISHETIYKYIWANKSEGGELYKNLRHHRKKYRKRGSSKNKHSAISNRIDIDERPSIVEKKLRLGDWELDTIVGKGHKGAVISIVDRASKLTKLFKLPRKTAKNTAQGILKLLTPMQDFVLTLTADNGGEFANHQQVSGELNASFYFAKPYHSWERGLNEHTNGLIRQYLPKEEGLDGVTQEDVNQIESLLNNRPRKVLQYLTPIEAFEELKLRSPIAALRT